MDKIADLITVPSVSLDIESFLEAKGSDPMNHISKSGHALGFLPSVGLPFFLVLCRCKGDPPYSTVQLRSMARQVLAFKLVRVGFN